MHLLTSAPSLPLLPIGKHPHTSLSSSALCIGQPGFFPLPSQILSIAVPSLPAGAHLRGRKNFSACHASRAVSPSLCSYVDSGILMPTQPYTQSEGLLFGAIGHSLLLPIYLGLPRGNFLKLFTGFGWAGNCGACSLQWKAQGPCLPFLSWKQV